MKKTNVKIKPGVKAKKPLVLRWWYVGLAVLFLVAGLSTIDEPDSVVLEGFLFFAAMMFPTAFKLFKRHKATRMGAHSINEHYSKEYRMVGLHRPDRLKDELPPVGTELFFMQEPGNSYDHMAIKAMWYKDGKLLNAGYLFQSDESIREEIRQYISKDKIYYSEVEQLGNRPRIYIGLK